jgi:hypothetical protein
MSQEMQEGCQNRHVTGLTPSPFPLGKGLGVRLNLFAFSFHRHESYNSMQVLCPILASFSDSVRIHKNYAQAIISVNELRQVEIYTMSNSHG